MASRASSSSVRSISDDPGMYTYDIETGIPRTVTATQTTTTRLVPVSAMKKQQDHVHELHAKHYGAIRASDSSQEDDCGHNGDLEDLERGEGDRSGPMGKRPRDMKGGLKGGESSIVGFAVLIILAGTAFVCYRAIKKQCQ